MKSASKLIIYVTAPLSFVLLLVIFTTLIRTPSAHAVAGPAIHSDYSASGWYAPRVEYVSESTTCSDGQAEIEFRLVEHGSQTTLVNPIGLWRVLVRDSTGGIVTGQTFNSGQKNSNGICFDPTGHGLQVVVTDSPDYVRLESPTIYATGDQSTMPGHKFISYIHLLSKATAAIQSPDIEAVFPANDIVYSLSGLVTRTNFIPGLYTPSLVNRIKFYILDDTRQSLQSLIVQDNAGTGLKFATSDGLPETDGFYYWLFHQDFNGSSYTTKPDSPLNWTFSAIPSTGASTLAPFAIDSGAPSLNTISAFETVGINGHNAIMTRVYLDLADDISGLSTTTLSIIDPSGTVLQTVVIGHVGSPNMRSLSVDLVVPSGSTYRYNLVTSDMLGLVSVSNVFYTAPSLDSFGPPVLSIPTHSDLTSNSAVLSSSVTNTGLSVINQIGFCWSTSTTALITLNPATHPTCVAETVHSTTTSPFNLTPSTLLPNTTYYYRAFARNALGYGLSPLPAGCCGLTTLGTASTFTSGPPVVQWETASGTSAVGTTFRGSVGSVGGVSGPCPCYLLRA
jgi:hypothetical protein